MKNWIVVFVVVLLSSLVLGVYLYYSDDSESFEKQIVEFEQKNGELTKIFEDKGNVRFEGTMMPVDFDSEKLLPKLPPTSELIGVIDNTQGSSRIISIKFKVYRNQDETKVMILDSLNSKGWKIEKLENTEVLKATMDNVIVYAEIRTLDRTFVEVNLVYNFATEPIFV